MKRKILAIDDEPSNLLILEEFLFDEDYEVTSFLRAEEGLDYLAAGHKVDAILLDRMMPGMDGMAFLERMKDREWHKHLPVIMQTAAASPSEIAEGLEAGVFYYLTKPFEQRMLLSVLRNAIKDYAAYSSLEQENARTAAALSRLSSCCFSFRTLEDVTNISGCLANLFPKPDEAILGIRELMLNAVEHGNLGISYDEKTSLNNEGNWEQEIQRRLELEQNVEKFAVAAIEKGHDEIVLTIKDQGPGFEWEKFMQMDLARALDNHGRGIAMSGLFSFDDLRYVAPGNKVVCTKRVNGSS
jgi:CheY-like chemotaxis protein